MEEHVKSLINVSAPIVMMENVLERNRATLVSQTMNAKSAIHALLQQLFLSKQPAIPCLARVNPASWESNAKSTSLAGL